MQESKDSETGLLLINPPISSARTCKKPRKEAFYNPFNCLTNELSSIFAYIIVVFICL